MKLRKLLFNDFQGGNNPRLLTMNDYDFLMNSGFLLLENSVKKNMAVVNKITQTIRNNE